MTDQQQLARRPNGADTPPIAVAPASMPDPERAGRIMEAVIAAGDLKDVSAQHRARYYVALCQSLGLNPMTQPFQYLYLNNKLVLYPRKECAEQLGRIYRVSTEVVSTETIADILVVRVRASTPDGRRTDATGAVPLVGKGGARLTGEELANAMMKAESKGKRRAIFSLIGLGWLGGEEGGEGEAKPVPMDRHGNPILDEGPERPAPRIPLEEGRDIFFGDVEPRVRVDPPVAPRSATARPAPAEDPPDPLEETLAEYAGQPEAAPKDSAGQPRLIDGEEVGPPGPLWADVLALVPKLDAAGITYILPRQDQPEDLHRGWIATKTTALRAKTGPHR